MCMRGARCVSEGRFDRDGHSGVWSMLEGGRRYAEAARERLQAREGHVVKADRDYPPFRFVLPSRCHRRLRIGGVGAHRLVNTAWMVRVLFIDATPILFQVSP
jgi:hypothetical protein